MNFVTLLDANCLAQVWIRILLLQAARHQLYQAMYSEDILTEVRDVLSRATSGGKALTAAQVNRAIDRLRDEALLVDGYQALIPAMTNNPKDRHVLAAIKDAAEAVGAGDVYTFLMRLQRLERFRDLVLASGLVQIPVQSPEK